MRPDERRAIVGLGLREVLLGVEENAVLCNVSDKVRRQVNEGDVVVSLGPRLFACRVAEHIIHVEGSGLLRESAIEPHEPDRLLQFPEVLVDVCAGQNSMLFAALDQNAGSFRGWRVPRSTEADSEVLHLVEHGVGNIFGHENLCYQMPTGARWSYGWSGQVCEIRCIIMQLQQPNSISIPSCRIKSSRTCGRPSAERQQQHVDRNTTHAGEYEALDSTSA